MLTFKDLKVANAARCLRWHPGGVADWSLSDWGVAAAGEMGEALNVIKKLNRSAMGIPGNKESDAVLNDRLGEELADVVIYLDLLAQRAGIDLEEAIVMKFNEVSLRQGFPDRLRARKRKP